jgi:uncharacterized protein
MQRRLLDLLACPDCKAPLTLEDEGGEDAGGPDGCGTGGGALGGSIGGPGDEEGEIVTGTLRCAACGFAYPVEAGIPNLLPQAFHRDEVQD